MVWVFSALAPFTACGADYTIKSGSTDVTVYVTLRPFEGFTINDIANIAHNDSNLKVYYVRDRLAVQQITTASQTVTGAHNDGGWVKLDDTNAPGRYRLDLPDAVCAANVRHAKVMITYSSEGMGEVDIDLVGYDPTAANLPANVTQFGGTNGVFSSGRPEVTTSNASNQAIANSNHLVLGRGTATATTPVVNLSWIDEPAGGAGPTVDIVGCMFIALDEFGESKTMRRIVSWNDQDTITLESAPSFPLDASSFVIVATPPQLEPIRTGVDDLLDYFDGAPTFGDAMDAQGYTAARAQKIDRLAPTLLVGTTINTLASQTSFTLSAGPSEDDALNGALVIVTNGTQKAVGIVRDYVGSSKTVTLVTDPQIFTMASGHQVDIIAGGPVPLWLGASP
jgi:hypothetical protein